jgi:hypothetical protein
VLCNLWQWNNTSMHQIAFTCLYVHFWTYDNSRTAKQISTKFDPLDVQCFSTVPFWLKVDNNSRHTACTPMNFLDHIVTVACSLFTKQVCLQTVRSDDALWTFWDFEINYYFIYNNLLNQTIIFTQQHNYTWYSSYKFFCPRIN